MGKTLCLLMFGLAVISGSSVTAERQVSWPRAAASPESGATSIAPLMPTLALIERRQTNHPGLPGAKHMPFRIGLGLSARYAGPYDTDNSSIDAGAGITADLISAISRGAALRFTLGLSGIHAADYGPRWYYLPPYPPLNDPLPVVSYDRDMTAMRYFLSLQYATPIGGSRDRAFFNLLAGFGAVTHFAREEIIAQGTGAELLLFRHEKTTTIPAVTFGCGAMIGLAPRLWLVLAVDTDLHLSGQPTCLDCHEPLRPLYDYDGSYGFSLGLVMGR